MTGTLDRVGPFHWKVFAIYVCAGPPIGAWLVVTFLFLYGMFSSGQFGIEVVAVYAMMLFYSLLITYLTGGVQAVATGLIAGSVAAFGDGRVGWWTALLAPTAVGMMAYPIIAAMSGDNDPYIALTLGGTGIAASLILKLLFNRTFSTPQISHP